MIHEKLFKSPILCVHYVSDRRLMWNKKVSSRNVVLKVIFESKKLKESKLWSNQVISCLGSAVLMNRLVKMLKWPCLKLMIHRFLPEHHKRLKVLKTPWKRGHRIIPKALNVHWTQREAHNVQTEKSRLDSSSLPSGDFPAKISPEFIKKVKANKRVTHSDLQDIPGSVQLGSMTPPLPVHGASQGYVRWAEMTPRHEVTRMLVPSFSGRPECP